MICPKCQADMHKLSTPDAEIDRCSQCNGLWFDMLEHTDVKAIAKKIDSPGTAHFLPGLRDQLPTRLPSFNGWRRSSNNIPAN